MATHLEFFLPVPFGKFMTSFNLMTFWWLPFKLTSENARTERGRIVKHHVGFPTIDNSNSHSPLHFDRPDAAEAIILLSKTSQQKNFSRVATVTVEMHDCDI